MKSKSGSLLAISSWSPDDKPRERLRKRGAAALSDAELVAILIRSGNREQSAVSLAKQILATVNHHVSGLSNYSLHQLMQFKGIGEAKAVTIMAAFEIGRRNNGQSIKQPTKIRWLVKFSKGCFGFP